MRKISFLIMAIIISSTLTCQSLKETRASALRVQQDYPSVQAVVDASIFGDAVFVVCGTYDDSVIATDYWIQFNGYSFLCRVLSNSSVSEFTFSQPERKISLNVTGETGTAGICNITIPQQLIGEGYLILLNGEHAWPDNATWIGNVTHASFCYNYIHSTHVIEIIGTTVIPEFPTIVANMTILVVLTLMLLFIKRGNGAKIT